MGPFIAEILPDTAARGAFMGLLYSGGRLGGLLAPSIIGLLATGGGGMEAGLATTVGAFVLALLVLQFIPETKGRILR